MSSLNINSITIESDVNVSENLRFGENGTLELTLNAISEKLVALFFKLVRNCSTNDIKTLYDSVINEVKDTPDLAKDKVSALITLCFMTRSCRGGKGERELFYQLFGMLNKNFPETTSELCKIISHYGYWKDCLNLIAKGMLTKGTTKSMLDIIASQIEKDLEAVEKGEKSISLISKWLPRETKALYDAINNILHTFGFNGFASEIMSRISSKHKKSLNGPTNKKYRSIITFLSSKLDLVETHICGTGYQGSEMLWESIDFSCVPSLAMRKYNHAFDLTPISKLPKDKRKGVTSNRVISPDKMEDRLACKSKYINHLTSGKVNGSQIQIEKLVSDVRTKIGCNRGNSVTNLTTESLTENGQYDLVLANRQFESYCDYVEEQLQKAAEESKESFDFNIDDIELMLDVSGSMEGVPMNACIGLGLVITELQRRKSKNRIMKFITFDSNPTYVTLDESMNFVQRVYHTQSAPWGGSTNINAAFELMMNSNGHNINHAKKKLMIFSDMQFDSAIGTSHRDYYGRSSGNVGWETMYETICTKWKLWYNLTEADSDKLVNITFWNLRGDTKGFPINSDTRGVIQISGFSASLVKMILFGDELAQVSSDEKEKKQPTPAEVLNRTLMAKEYDLVRTTLQSISSVFNREIEQLLTEKKVELNGFENSQYVNTHIYYDSDNEVDNEL